METESDQLQLQADSNPKIQMMGGSSGEEDELQQKTENEGAGVQSIESDLKSSKGGGSPLDDSTKNQMESKIV